MYLFRSTLTFYKVAVQYPQLALLVFCSSLGYCNTDDPGLITEKIHGLKRQKHMQKFKKMNRLRKRAPTCFSVSSLAD